MAEKDMEPEHRMTLMDKERKRSGESRRRTPQRSPSSSLNSLADPFKVISAAIAEVPAVRFALGLAGVAAAASVVGTFVGSGSAAIVTMVAMLLGMLCLYIVSVITTGGEVKPLPLHAAVVLWAVTLFMCAMLSLLTTALAFGWPDHFARTIHLETSIYAGLTSSPAKGDRQTSHISGNDCKSDGPPVTLYVTATPGWKLVSGTAHLVLDRDPINGVASPLSGGIEDPSHHQFSASFYAIRNNGSCGAGEAKGHLEATQTWDWDKQ
jgi:hypothetical protein